MTDVLTAEQRHRCMSHIRGKDTGPELTVRRTAYALGFRYRLHVSVLPGKPDLVFRKLRKVIFVHGCFWHMHSCKFGRVTPATNKDFWKKKREGNRVRDARNKRSLQKSGWKVLYVWECQTRNESMLRAKLQAFLNN
jgi:DNA mismatch endonuclease (patch repair protein)